MRTAFVVSVALVVSAACGSSSILEHVFSIRITAATTAAAVGDEVDFTFEATGGLLVGVIVAYGDGVADSVDTSGGVNSISGRFAHAFQTEGIFLVEAIAVDAQAGRLTDTVSVNITP